MRYSHCLGSIDEIDLPREKSYATCAFHNYVIKVNNPKNHNKLITYLKEHGISTEAHYITNYLYSIFAPFAKERLPIAEAVWESLITLPLFQELTFKQQGMIIDCIHNYFLRR